MKSSIKLGLLGLLIIALAGLPLQGRAQTTNKVTPAKKPAVEKKTTATTTKEAPANKAKPIPFHGDLASVDKVAKTLTIGQRTFQVTSETKLFLSDKKTPAVFDAATAGQHVTGSYRKGEDGKLAAVSVYFGEKVESKEPAKKAAPSEKPKKAKAPQ